MKILVISALFVSLCQADSTASQETKTKAPTTTKTNVYSTQKPEYVVQQQQQTQPQYYPVQYFQKPYYVPQQTQPAMFIIAQPALVPQHLLYNNQMQQLLNYFHSNPQARYQLLHGYQPQPSYITHNSIASPSIGNYQIVPPPHLPSSLPPPSQFNFVQQSPHQHLQQHQQGAPFPPVQLNEIAHLAHLTAQSVASAPSFPYRTVPAIVTGFENFTPDQQAQIKAQLSAHFGPQLGSPSSTNQPQNHYPKYVTGLSNNQEYLGGSPKSEVTTTNYNPPDIYKSQYSKG